MNGYSFFVRQENLYSTSESKFSYKLQIPYIFYVLFYTYVVFIHIYSPNNGKYLSTTEH